MSATPPAGAADTAFNAPPGWRTPLGFDPRRGHLADPTWPPAPDGWQFWVARPAPRGPVSFLRRGWWGPVLGGAVVLAVVALGFLGGPTSPTDGVGSCWARGGGKFTSVDCSSSGAGYRVSAVVARPETCPSSSVGYLDGPHGAECLVRMP